MLFLNDVHSLAQTYQPSLFKTIWHPWLLLSRTHSHPSNFIQTRDWHFWMVRCFVFCHSQLSVRRERSCIVCAFSLLWLSKFLNCRIEQAKREAKAKKSQKLIRTDFAVVSLFRGIRVWKLFRRRSFRGVAKEGNFSKKGKTRAGLFRSAERPQKKKVRTKRGDRQWERGGSGHRRCLVRSRRLQWRIVRGAKGE